MASRDERTAVLDTALRAQACGISVVRVREDGTKMPQVLDGWREHQHRRADEPELREMFTEGSCGVGFVCGAVSGDLELLDFDVSTVFDDFADCCDGAGLGELLDRVQQGYLEETPNGFHLFYRCDDPKTTKLARREKLPGERSHPDDRIQTLIETKGEGGYAIVAPSCGGVHASGLPYKLIKGGPGTIVRISMEEREALHRIARSLDRLPNIPREPRPSLPTGIGRPGDDFNTRAVWPEVLEPHGWARVYEQDGATHWRRPGKSGGISATTNYAGSGLLYVFSTSTAFEADCAYSKFAAYAVLNHGGDFSAAAAELREQGFGSDQRESNSPNFSNSAQEWERPVEFTSEVYGPPLPTEALPEPIRAYVRDVSAVRQVPEDAVIAAALSALTAATARRAVVAIGSSHLEPLNGYFVLVAGSGLRKSAVFRDLTFPFEDEEKSLLQALEPQIRRNQNDREFAERRIRHLRDQASKENNVDRRETLLQEAFYLEEGLPAEIHPPQLLLDDSTPEHIKMALGQQRGVMFVASEEGGALFGNMTGRYSGDGHGDLDVFLKAYDGGMIRVGRTSRDVTHVDAPALSMLLAAQPSLVEGLGDHDYLRGRGLLARICFVAPPNPAGTRFYADRGLDMSARDAYSQLIRRLLSEPIADPQQIPTLRIVGPALSAWAAFHDQLEGELGEGGTLASLADFASKHPGRAARIAAQFHMVRHHPVAVAASNPIGVQDVEAAWAIAMHLLEHQKAVFDLIGVDPVLGMAKRILRWIRRKSFEQFSVRDLHDIFRDVKRSDDFLPALRVLEDRHFVRELSMDRPQGTRGRKPARKFSVNPLVRNSGNSGK